MDNTSKQTDGTSQSNVAQGGVTQNNASQNSTTQNSVTQNNASQNSTTQNGAAQSTASQSGAATGGASSLTSLPGMKAEVATWVQFMRRPGMVLSLDIQKRYVSNMDAETASGAQGSSSMRSFANSSANKSTNSSANGSASASTQSAGGNAGTGASFIGTGNSGSAGMFGSIMTSSYGGSTGQPGVMCYREVCRVRFFDLAVGTVAALLVGGMIRCISGCVRRLR
ncbi:MAG: hypothetical protein IIV80_00635 [Clostridia bacterium]|nr:hypothetical protein [Clostridia bacterium]MBQ5724637.1 hypothetical protein [Clostridia bacterium]